MQGLFKYLQNLSWKSSPLT